MHKDESLNFKKMTIQLIGNEAIVECPGLNGLTSIKTIKISTLVKAFQEQDNGIETPILPRNTIKYQERGNRAVLYMYQEPTKFTATVGSVKYENCIRPGLIMIVQMNRSGDAWTINDTKCYAVKDDRLLLNNETVLYGLPFPNISDDGWICWGDNALGGVFQSFTGLGMLIDRLFNSPFNSHIFHAGSFTHLGIDNHKDFFKYIQDKDHFPSELYLNTVNDYRLGTV